MNTYKHSGAFGDLIYSLMVVKNTGGGRFYLHLDQLNWIGQHFYGSAPNPFHQGRLTLQDFEFMKSFMLAQSYIEDFQILDPRTHEISHNLDRFRAPFVHHPCNYLDLYGQLHGVDPTQIYQPWLTVPKPVQTPGRTLVVNRTARWTSTASLEQWQQLGRAGLDQEAVFVGLAEEHQAFVAATGWKNILYRPTDTLLELAQIIAGADRFIGNQSQCFALAVGLGLKNIDCEIRRDLPMERNECYFPKFPEIRYF